MVEKVIKQKQLAKLVKTLAYENKSIVLAGGCFDVLHPGHIQFLTKAKAYGDILIVLLESDERIRRDKGSKRPIHTQLERAYVLSAVSVVDYIIQLQGILTSDEYDRLVIQLKPAIIATTAGDSFLRQRKRQAATVGSRVVSIPKRKSTHSTTRVATLLTNEL